MIKTLKTELRLIETDAFPFEFLSKIGERESWRKEIHRPIYHVHKWWAKRLGSVFRGILLGCISKKEADLEAEFYKQHWVEGISVFDPFMGSGTTLGEAHKLGLTALGRDINPVAVNAVNVALGPMDWGSLQSAFTELSFSVGETIRALYRSKDSQGYDCDVLYYFWVMKAGCTACERMVDLFSSYVIARNAYPDRRPEIQVLCPSCERIFQGLTGQGSVSCPECGLHFDPEKASAKGADATCQHCGRTSKILQMLGGKRPGFRLYGKLVLTGNHKKEYLRATEEDFIAYRSCSLRLKEEESRGILLPSLTLKNGHNTQQALRYGFVSWRDFFNDRQLLALAYLQNTILRITDEPTRNCLLTLFRAFLSSTICLLRTKVRAQGRSGTCFRITS